MIWTRMQKKVQSGFSLQLEYLCISFFKGVIISEQAVLLLVFLDKSS